MTAEYVRERYGVPATPGARVVIAGRTGTVVSFPDIYIGVRFDGPDRRVMPRHPSRGVTYLPARARRAPGARHRTRLPRPIDA